MKETKTNPAQVGLMIRNRRKALGYSLRELSARSGIAASFLSKIENGKGSPTLMSLLRILEALDTDLTEFFQNGSTEDPSDAVVFPRGEMKAFFEEDRMWVLAFPSHPSIGIRMSYEEYKPRTRIEEVESHPMDVCGMVLEGELTLELPGRGIRRARTGDAFYIRANTPHISRNETDEVLRLVVVRALGARRPARAPDDPHAARDAG